MANYALLDKEKKVIKLLSSVAAIKLFAKVGGVDEATVLEDIHTAMLNCQMRGTYVFPFDEIQGKEVIMIDDTLTYRKSKKEYCVQSFEEAILLLEKMFPDKDPKRISAAIAKNLDGKTKTCYGGSWSRQTIEYNLKDFTLERGE